MEASSKSICFVHIFSNNVIPGRLGNDKTCRARQDCVWYPDTGHGRCVRLVLALLHLPVTQTPSVGKVKEIYHRVDAFVRAGDILFVSLSIARLSDTQILCVCSTWRGSRNSAKHTSVPLSAPFWPRKQRWVSLSFCLSLCDCHPIARVQDVQAELA